MTCRFIWRRDIVTKVSLGIEKHVVDHPVVVSRMRDPVRDWALGRVSEPNSRVPKVFLAVSHIPGHSPMVCILETLCSACWSSPKAVHTTYTSKVCLPFHADRHVVCNVVSV